MKQRKIILTHKESTTHWHNIVADMENKPRPPLHPGTQEPIGPEMLAPLFPEELIRQEVSQEKWIEIPEEVREIYSIWRPTPIFRAYGLEKRSEEHTSELQSRGHLVCRLLLEKKKYITGMQEYIIEGLKY